jgi:hypothetical protein
MNQCVSQPARRALPDEVTPVSGVRVRRPASQVVVRAGARPGSENGERMMPRVPTLIGCTVNQSDGRKTLCGLTAPVWDDDEPMEPLPARATEAERKRPEILIEEVDQKLAERYRREAQRIIAAGFFS